MNTPRRVYEQREGNGFWNLRIVARDAPPPPFSTSPPPPPQPFYKLKYYANYR
jgi:hypothetical protein